MNMKYKNAGSAGVFFFLVKIENAIRVPSRFRYHSCSGCAAYLSANSFANSGLEK